MAEQLTNEATGWLMDWLTGADWASRNYFFSD